MTALTDSQHRGTRVCHYSAGVDYNPVGDGFLVEEESIIQTASGRFLVDVTVLTTRETSLMRARVDIPSVGVTVVKPDYITFAIPVAWCGDYSINGEPASSACIYTQPQTYYMQGGRRETIGVVLRREKFIETIAALRGTGPEDVRLSDSTLELTPAAIGNLRTQLLAHFCHTDKTPGQRDADDFDKEIFGLLADVYLHARPGTNSSPSLVRQPERIVRKAEERFHAAGGKAISLADLCAAAGVSKSTLYLAFNTICGESPLAYFHKRRLMQARSNLHNAAPERGAVKKAALEAGLTELGRFSVEYRRLFGESPSSTLNNATC